jgi:3-oxoacyl-[acyl-carrier protein] reductase
MQLSEQVVLITGASRGLGAAIARRFADEGARVALNYYRSEEKARALAEEIGPDSALALGADVRDPEQVRAMADETSEYFGDPVSTAVSNALVGGYRFDPEGRAEAGEIAWARYDEQLRGSVRGSLNVLQACLPGMREQAFGRVVAIGSNLVQNPVVPYHDYTTAKAAQLGWVRNMAAELGPDGVTVNMASGGLLKTTDASAATSEEVFGAIESTTPLRKATTPEEVADAVLFFASPWSRAVTGQNLIVDGGLVMK